MSDKWVERGKKMEEMGKGMQGGRELNDGLRLLGCSLYYHSDFDNIVIYISDQVYAPYVV